MPRIERPDMAAYGVPEDPAGALAWDWARTRLVATKNYWVTTVDSRQRPHSMPVWGLWLSEPDCFWFSCAPTAYKARNLRANPAIVLTGDDSVDVVSVEGTATEKTPDRSIAAKFGTKYEPDQDKIDGLVDFFMEQTMFQVTPARAFGIIERENEFSERATRWVW